MSGLSGASCRRQPVKRGPLTTAAGTAGRSAGKGRPADAPRGRGCGPAAGVAGQPGRLHAAVALVLGVGRHLRPAALRPQFRAPAPTGTTPAVPAAATTATEEAAA